MIKFTTNFRSNEISFQTNDLQYDGQTSRTQITPNLLLLYTKLLQLLRG